MVMVDHAEMGGWTEQREADPNYFFWFDLTVLNFVCPECLADGRLVMMAQHAENTPHYHCPSCQGGILNRQLVPWLGPSMPSRINCLN